MKGLLQCTEEIKWELPFFMPAHLLAVGSLILGHKENGIFTSAYLHTPAGHKPAFTVCVLILCGWWGAAAAQTPDAPLAVKFNCIFPGMAFFMGGGYFMMDRLHVVGWRRGHQAALALSVFFVSLCDDAGRGQWFTYTSQTLLGILTATIMNPVKRRT